MVPATLVVRIPCMGRVSVSPARGVGDGHPVSQYLRAFFSGGYPWRSSVLLLRVRAVAVEIQPLSEQRDHGRFFTDVLATLTLFLLVLLNPAACRAVHPTPAVPALTSMAGASLSFVFLTPSAAPRALLELPVSVWIQ